MGSQGNDAIPGTMINLCVSQPGSCHLKELQST